MAAEFVGQFQSFSESDKQWQAREEFIIRNLKHFEDESALDRLLALSMVWANHVFMGCRPAHAPAMMSQKGMPDA
ncbi:hypothetical protein XENTR_v10008034 [Xenopus tropicalis]|nr:hypothetical protein XENTR_v10008034 [Xenopus tropicalis]KAE8614197.1 hypothetical protein XENTR_v10008034 [Xenopus tropicalis]